MMIRQYIKIVIFTFLVPLVASAADDFEEKAPPSFADPLKLMRSTNPENTSWLPQISGLPNNYEVATLSRHLADVMIADEDTECTSIDLNLRTMIFQHFLIYQQMLNAQNIYLDEEIAYKWAHVLAMTLKESSGDSANITDMCGYSISTNQAKTNLSQWRKILSLSNRSHVQLNYQTNFGLTQTSSDRLIDAFELTKDQQLDFSFLQGTQDVPASTSIQPPLNTASAILRLIWFYQGFAQGRILQSDEPIKQEDIDNPLFSARYKQGIEMALLYCGTRFMFAEEFPESGSYDNSNLQNAMASIAYCKLGNQKTGYGENQVDEQCFAEWVTLCPALNIDIATLSPLSYFATRGAKPVCKETFKRLINKKPGEINF